LAGQREAAVTDPGGTHSPLRARTARDGGEVTLTLTGDIDVTTVEIVREAARRCRRESPALLSLDLRSVSFCDVAGVRALRWAQREAAGAGAEFRIIAPQPMVMRVFILTSALDLLSAAQDPRNR
jgi:anti-anti-sigma factor